LVTLSFFSMALVTAPSLVPAFAAGGGGGGGGGGDTPAASGPGPDARSTPARTTHKTKKKADKQSLFNDSAFANGYRAAYATIYDRNDYAAAIEQLKALGHDEHPNVANLI